MYLIPPVSAAIVWLLVIVSARSISQRLLVALGVLFAVMSWMIGSSGWGPRVGLPTAGVSVLGLGVALWRRQSAERAWYTRLAGFGLPADTPSVELSLDGFAGETGPRKAWLLRYGAVVWLIPDDATYPAFQAPHHGFALSAAAQNQIILHVPNTPPTPLVVVPATTEMTEVVRLRNRIASLIA